MMRPLCLTFAILCAVPVVALSQDKAPDLTGIWQWNPHQSQPSSGHPPDDMRVRIEQTGSEISITWRVRHQTNEEQEFSRLRIGSDDNQNQIHGAPMKSSARWRAGALTVDSVATFSDNELLRMRDVWTLSADGQTLTFKERHQFAAEPAGESVYVFDRQVGGTWELPEDSKPAEQVYKNIQVMQGVPAAQLQAAMAFFSRALGVECGHCHDPNAFEKDDNPAKATARRMLKMVHQINDGNFAPDHPVSCWTCHRGSVKPESNPK